METQKNSNNQNSLDKEELEEPYSLSACYTTKLYQSEKYITGTKTDTQISGTI